MLQTTRKLVTVYRSTDEHAPQLAAAAGCLKTILKACLVEGYGNKPSLGWEMPFEEAHSAVFRSKNPQSTGMALQIKNPQPRGAEARMMINPTALDEADAILARGRAKFPYLTSYGGAASGLTWMVIGHDSAFALLLKGLQLGVRLLWFGDFPSTVAGDNANCLLYVGNEGNDDYLSSTTYEPKTIFASNSNSFFVLAKSFDGLTPGVFGVAASFAHLNRGLPYPDPIIGGLTLSESYIAEQIRSNNGTVYPLRGLWPGMYYCANNLRTVPNYTELGGFAGNDDRFIKVLFSESGDNHVPYGYYLINITAWQG